jgi:hypothetical protein
LQGLPDLADQVVVDADVGQRAADRPGTRAGERPQQRVEEQQPDQGPPQRPAGGAGRGQVDGLVQLDLAVRASPIYKLAAPD